MNGCCFAMQQAFHVSCSRESGECEKRHCTLDITEWLCCFKYVPQSADT